MKKILSLIILIFVQYSHQQSIISRSSTVVASCTYSYDRQNRYSCHLTGAIVENPADTLVIVGTHLPGHTDAHVTAISHDFWTSFTRFNGETLRKFTNLKYIDFRRIRIHSISPNAFDVCDQLEEIDFGFTSWLNSLPSRLFNNCHNLKIFRVTQGHITFPGDLFGDAKNLEIFDVTSGTSENFPDDILQNMQNLRVFRMSGMRLTQLSSNILRNARNLQEFDIAGNRITDGQQIMNILSSLLTLRKIHISFNYFTMFHLNFFTRFPNLLVLSIGGEEPQSSFSFQSLPRTLTHLSCSGISENIPADSFNNLPNLIQLVLIGQGISELHQDTFAALSNLQSLSIVYTRISSLNSELFRNQINLKGLGFTFSQVRVLPAGIFTSLSNLTELSIFHNRIQRLPMNIFGNHPHLNFIDFMNNDINAIQRGIFSLFSPTLDYVNFFGNKCVQFNGNDVSNLDEHEEFQGCFDNFDGITITRPPSTVPTTTPDGCGISFRKFEIFLILFVGIFLNIF